MKQIIFAVLMFFFVSSPNAFSANYPVIDADWDLCALNFASRFKLIKTYKEGDNFFGVFQVYSHGKTPFALPVKSIGSKVYVNTDFMDVFYQNVSGQWVWHSKKVNHSISKQILKITESSNLQIIVPLPSLKQVKFSRTWLFAVNPAEGNNDCIRSDYLYAKLKREPVVKRLKSE